MYVPDNFSKVISTVSLLLFLLGGQVISAHAQTSYPMLMALEPVALQVGHTSEFTVESRYSMFEAYEVLVSGEGVTGRILSEMKTDKNGKPPAMTKLKIQFTATEDALLGVRDFRIATPNGISTVGQLVLTPHPVVVEGKDNNTSDKAQPLEVPAALCGSIEKREDVDYFKFTIKEVGDWNFHVRGMRLQDKIHDLQQHADPILTLRSAEGAILAVSDNFYFADPFLVHHFEEPGHYLLEMRDVRYQGNRFWRYCVEINSTPYATTAHPLAVARGTATELELMGPSVPTSTKASVPVDHQAPMGTQSVSIPMNDTNAHPVELLVTETAPVVENQVEKHGTLETAVAVSLPTIISGTISEPDELDLYQFEATKGELFTFEVKARRLQSSLDSIIRIMNAEGKTLKEADDLTLFRRNYSDSLLEAWKAPADGTYYLEIRDLHLRGGDTFTYAIEATRAEPHFFLELDTDKTIVTPGTSSVMFIRAYKKNGFNGDIKLEIDHLPEGVSASCGTIPAGKQRDGCIILTAAADAPMAVSPIVVRGIGQHTSTEGDPLTYSARAVPMQETYRPGGGRAHWPVGSHIVSVGKPGDIRSLKLNTQQISLKPGEKVKIEITLERAEGFNKNILLDPVFSHLGGVFGNTLPPGVKMNKKESKILLTGTEAKGHVVLEADSKAKPAKPQQVAMMANISLNFVMKRTYCAEPLWVTIAN